MRVSDGQRGVVVQVAQHCLGYLVGQARRYGVANLAGHFHLAAAEAEIVGKRLEPGRFAVGDGPVGHGMQVTAFFGLVKLGADGDRWPVPPQAAEQVGAPAFVEPAVRREFIY